MYKAAFGLLLLAPAALLSQSTPVESLLIGPGDMIHVRVFDAPEFEERVRVDDSGLISVAVAGDVMIAGMTPSDAGKAVERVLLDRQVMLHPHVILTVEDFATSKVSILGEVKAPGAYTITTPRMVLDLLALAGGLTDFADRNIVVEHHRTKQRETYFVSNNPVSALDQSFMIQPGDRIIVARAGIVYAIGNFNHPGGFVMNNNESKISALELVAHAGGLPPTAAVSRARLIRKQSGGYVEISLPLNDIQKGNRADIALQPDDILYVPFSYAKSYAVGLTSIVGMLGSAAIYHF